MNWRPAGCTSSWRLCVLMAGLAGKSRSGMNCLGQTLIPPLTLQPIVENAVVHGLLPREEGGQVRILVYRDGAFVSCEIADNGIGRAAAAVYQQKSSRLHQSKGLHLLEERITVHNRLNEGVSSLQTTDLFGADGSPSGTRVTIKFNTGL